MSTERTYRPSADFRKQLEWEVTRAYRRADRADAFQRGQRGSWLRVAVIAIVSIAIGTTAGLASAQIGRSQEKDSLLAAARAEAMLANLRRDIAHVEADDVTKKVRVGAEDEQAAVRARAELRAMDLQLARAGLNIEEINASGHAPRDDLNSPLVAGRDFVRQRIELDAAAAQQRLRATESEQAEVDRRLRVGAVGEIERLAGLVDVARARSEMAVLADKLGLRAEYVAKSTPVEDLTRRLERAQLEQDITVAQAALALARARVDVVAKQRKAGIADETAQMKAQLEFTTRALEIDRLQSRMNEVSRRPQ